MDFSISADPPQVIDFRKEVRGWLEENMRVGEHLRWSASWSTRENEEEYKFRRGLAEKLGAKGWLFPTLEPEYGGAGLTAAHQAVIDAELSEYGLALDHIFYTL